MFSPSEALPRLAPKLDQLTREALFGDVWQRAALSPRERSLITIAALLGQSRPHALAFHLRRGLDNGLAADELAEVVTHLAFYVGWPSATAALEQLDAVLADPTL
ncbi:carboxymuconolactone decarboxylase [Chromobacterium violaceum]|uniref:carboxymuconolactone decarboxylase family protein n=1 Tax=Chromobacterium violaceum TaxID=536 RepID=UPI0005B94CEB|nr:carboxymuconolactone decarboxylase family protein [Chromobacterium violaceum]OQS10763.1 carboxymuconolactone decarboxylase [Chromobacterium violaceum]OQS27192.1 carboxymuconolactone decarboxylase [Chromobacterium violaceum]